MKPRKILELSTAHLTKKDNTFLTDQARICAKPNKETPKLFVEALSYGFLILFPENIMVSLSTTLTTIIKKAVKKNCSFILIDSNAPTYKKLKTFKW